MDQNEFRKLLATPRPEGPAASSRNVSATPALGSRMRSSIPMTPRSLTVGNNLFAKQLAEQRASQQPQRKFRSSAAPKGTKLAAGYVDRAKAREKEDEDERIKDEREQRLAALEQLAKDGQIDREEFVRQTKLLGGDLSSTHLVKGLDFKLLARMRAGESGDKEEDNKEEEVDEDALEDKLDQALEKDVAPVERKKEKKRGETFQKPVPRTRAEILAELKAQRLAKEQKEKGPSLGDKFKKISDRKEEKVKTVVGPDGKVKRLVKRSDKAKKDMADMPPPSGPTLGMMPPPPLPSATKEKVEEPADDDDDDIFGGVAEYDPLADEESDSSEDEREPTKRPKAAPSANTASNKSDTPSAPLKGLFADEPEEDDTYKPPSSAADLLKTNPELAAALQKASKIAPPKTKEEEEKEKRRRAILEGHDRDAYDIDFGFGASRDFGDEDDDDGAYGGDKKGGGKKRKRGKKKGDKNSADVVGKIVEQKYGKGD